MFEVANYKLTDVLQTAGATVGIIIAGGILLRNLGAKYIAIFDRYRGLASEYRGNGSSDARRGNLQTEISCYRRQISYLNYATMFVSVALLVFLLSVAVAGLSIVYPKALFLRTVGTADLVVGLALIGIGVFLQLLETFVQRHSIGKEAADFSDQLPSTEEALRR